MDSLTQAILGASIAEFLGGKKYGNKAPLIGAIVATIPDLDVFIGPLLYGDSLQAELFHRSVTHSLFFSVLAAPLIGRVISKIIPLPGSSGSNSTADEKQKSSWRDRTIISFWALITHRILDLLTGYGTQWLRPFSTVPFSGDSIFIIDPLYTIPFLLFLLIALFHHKLSKKRRFWNGLALIVSTLYLLRGVGVKQTAQQVFSAELEQQGISYETMHASPEALSTFLRRGRAQDETNRYIGRRSIFDADKEVVRKTYPKNHELLTPYIHDSDVKKLLRRRRYNIIVQPSQQGATVIPIQFGDLFGWTQGEANFLFAYDLTVQGSGVRIEQPHRGRQLPSGRRPMLYRRVLGDKGEPAPSPTAEVGKVCQTNEECETPMEYLVRSVCPFSSKCIEGTCKVVCVDRYDTEKQELRKDQQCSVDEQCDCSTFYGAQDIISCSCIDGLCTAVIE